MSAQIRRREFITLLGGAAAAWPLAAGAQQAATPVVGFLSSYSSDAFAQYFLPAFHQGLNLAGYVEGQNVAIEYRWAGNEYERLTALAGELVRLRVSVITAGSASLAAVAAKAATTTIPIVFLMGGDPVELGFVASLNRPGGNLTGITTLNTEITPKRVEVLRELVPTTSIMAVLVNPTNNPANVEIELRQAQVAARTLGLQTIQFLLASTERDLDNRLLNIDPAAGRRARDHRRYIVQREKRGARHPGVPPRNAHDFSVSRVRDGRWPDELRRQRHRVVPPCRPLHRPRAQGREAG